MLSPKDRTLLFNSLHPPDEYQLDTLVVTTFSLDLMTLLAAPLAFTFFDWQGKDGEPIHDSTALLHAIRQHSKKIHVFCQAGQIIVPKNSELLFNYLEPCVLEVSAFHEQGVFHPKVWIVRYVAENKPVKYRLLCASRNLTYDRSWDTLLVLDGIVTEERKENNLPLAELIFSLQNLVIRKLPGQRKNTLVKLSSEIVFVEFELPKNVEQVNFWSLGLSESENSWPFPEKADQSLIISPFVSDGTLKRLNISKRQTLISRLDELGSLQEESVSEFDMYVFSEGTQIEPDSEVSEEGSFDYRERLTGLHAKLFAFDVGRIGKVWTGSANATDAAFHRNVEFLVEMQGKRGLVGADAILRDQENGVSVLNDILEPITLKKIDDNGPSEKAMEFWLLELRNLVIDLEFVIQVEEQGTNQFEFSLSPSKITTFPIYEFHVTCWPISLKQSTAAHSLSQENFWSTSFPSLSFEALTTFVAFEVSVRSSASDELSVCRFVLNLPATGFPYDRKEKLLLYMLKDRKRLITYLYFLLDEEALSFAARHAQVDRGIGSSSHHYFQAHIPLLERLVRALAYSPDKLDQIQRLVSELRSTKEGLEILPEEFDQIWIPLWEARQELLKHD